MDPKFYNRVTGETSPLPSQLSIFGQWQYIGRDGEAFNNSIPTQKGDFIVPDGDLFVNVTELNSADEYKHIYEKNFLLAQSERHFLDVFDIILQADDDDRATWEEWNSLPILDPNIKENIHILGFDLKIEDWLKHLQIVCKQPQTHLTMNLEKVPVGYARRFKAKTYSYLASHTEDWERRTLTAVYPKRVLSLRTEELWSIYENIVAVRLVDRLLSYINQRIGDVEKNRKVIEDASNYSTELAQIHFSLQRRLANIWGNMIETQSAIRQCDLTLSFLRDLKFKIAGLTDSILYKQVSRNSKIPDELRLTNILVYDNHYKHIALLWNEWNIWRSKGKSKQSPKQTYLTYQQTCHRFSAYCIVLVYRALLQQNFIAQSPKPPCPNGIPVWFSNGSCELEIVWDPNEVIHVLYNGKNLLSLVPLPIHLSAHFHGHPLQETIRLLTGELDSVNAGTSGYRVLLYYGRSFEINNFSEDIRRGLYSYGGGSSYGENNVRGLIPVSPIDLFSVERIGRVLRWVLLDHMFLAYPSKVTIPVQFSQVIGAQSSRWLKPKLGVYDIIELPNQEEINRLKNSLDLIRRTEETKPKHMRKDLQQLDEFIKILYTKVDETKKLYYCPLCNTDTPLRNFHNTGEDSFECHCDNSSCGAIWKVQKCVMCKRRYPILVPGSIDKLEFEDIPGWADHILGQDILSAPNLHYFPARSSFICPKCGFKEN